jgi:diaminohydroxyphosphoribosylaminopyrimidine deaminase/5-amino-6-(5-phosphoribosylamino)uracil reductase
MSEDERWMRRAIELASRGKGRVEPNPPVGAVIVRNGEIIGEGWHEKFGGPHAEVRAMESAGRGCSGATLYVTLEPCTGRDKKTPPCRDAVIEAGLGRVVIGSRDTTREPAAPAIQAAGIEVVTGVLEKECRRLIAPFLKLKHLGMPWVIAKWAMTADGRTATTAGESKWISSEESRTLAHRWRNEVDAVLVGAGTVRRDDPLLTCRMTGGRDPARVVVDSSASLSTESALARSVADAPLILACAEAAPEERCRELAGLGVRILRCPDRNGRVDLEALLRELGKEQMTNLLVEGGGHVMGEFFDRRTVDEVRIFIAPKLFGGESAFPPIRGVGIKSAAEAVTLVNVAWRQVGEDMLLCGDVARSA